MLFRSIFEPFFTTKPVGKGTGLGLSIVHAIVTRCGGGIQVSSAPGQETSFQIYFPQIQNTLQSTGRSSDPQRSLRGTETILLVDDDELVRRATRSILMDYGYTVVEAENGSKAMQVHLEKMQSIQLLVTDQMMPEMSGADLVKNISRIRPGLPILLISGFITEDEIGKYSLDKNVTFLRKPFQPQALASKVRDLLEQEVSI